MNQGFRDMAEALGGKRDPRLDKAIKLEALKNKVNSDATTMGIDQGMNPEEYAKLVYARAMESGMPDVAVEAMKFGKQEEYKRREMQVKEKLADAAMEKADKTGNKPTANSEASPFQQSNIKKILKGTPLYDELADDKDRDNFALDVANRSKAYMNANKGSLPDDAHSEAFDYYSDRIMPTKKNSLFGIDALYPDSPAYYAKNPEDVIKAVEDKRLMPEQAKQIIRKHWPKWQPKQQTVQPKKGK
jgi:hypothetical protein